MKRIFGIVTLVAMMWVGCLVSANAEDKAAVEKKGTVPLKSAGPIAFSPEGVLFIGDPMQATIFAVPTADVEAANDSYTIQGIDQKVAGALGVDVEGMRIQDLAVNPKSGIPFLSVSRGTGPDAQPIILTINDKSELEEFSLKNVSYTQAALPNVPGPDEKTKRGELKRTMSITDLAFINNQVVIAGLSNEEFESNLRAVSYPFQGEASGTSVEVFHGAHGKFETHAPVRTFTSIMIDDKPHVIAAYTCTPLVRFPLDQLTTGKKIRGTTVAELGNRNTPLDMIVYKKDGKEFILMANSARGMMKISTENIQRDEGIVEQVADKAGQTYETIEGLASVVQMDRLNDKTALVIKKNQDGSLDLATIELP
jgi:hypothetical protein